MLLSVAHFQNDIYISVLVRTDSSMAGVVGFEPTECRSQSPMPYHLAIPQYTILFILSHFLYFVYNILLVNSVYVKARVTIHSP